MTPSAPTPPPNLQLRPALPTDESALFPIHRAAYMDLITKTWGPWNEVWQQSNFHQSFDCSIRTIIHADNNLVGYFDVERHPDHLWLGEIVITPAFQRRGIANQILRQLLSESQRKSHPLKLQVLKTNHALHWYTRSGFRITGHTDTHTLMQFDPAQIRPATVSDIPHILSLIRELAAYENLSSACIATEELLAQHLLGTDRAAEALVAELGPYLTNPINPINSLTSPPPIIAYAIYFKTFSTFLARPGIYLEDIYVQPAHRRQGIGKALLKHLAQIAIQRNYGRVEWSVLDWNKPSIDFYKSLGAQPLDEWTMFRLTGDALQNFAATR